MPTCAPERYWKMIDNRATGWKVPLLFCAGIIAVSALSVFLRGIKPGVEVAPVPDDLLAKARTIVIDLEATPQGRMWKERIYRASGGFSSRQSKDDSMIQVAESAIEFKAFDAACAATTLVYDNQRRDAIFFKMSQAVHDDCENLPWAVFASKGLEDNALRDTLNKDLAQQWDKCKK